MNTIERIRTKILELASKYVPSPDSDMDELMDFLDSLASERCVWKLQPDKKYPGLGLYFPIDHPEFLTFGFYQQSFDEFKFCPYCGKQIEVKEV
jgi:hypothetical protein